MANFGTGTQAIVQSVNQYGLGLTGGYVIDLLMNQLPVDPENIWGRLAKQFLQTAINGVSLAFMLKFLHGSGSSLSTYRDPTGGYLLAIGLIQAQPSYMKNGKDLAKGLHAYIREQTLMMSAAESEAIITDESPQE